MADKENKKFDSSMLPNDDELPPLDGSSPKELKKTSKIKIISTAILSKLAKLKQKKYWIPLVVGHALMFSGMGYFVYSEEKFKSTPEYLIETITESFNMNSPALLNQVFNAAIFIDNTYKTIHDNLELNPDFALYIGELPEKPQFNQNMSLMLLNIMKGDDAITKFDKKRDIFPNKLASQLRKTPIKINYELSDPAKNIYILETNLYTIKWGNYRLLLTAKLQDGVWNITEITNLKKIIEEYNKVLKRIREQKENRIAGDKAHLEKIVNQYLPNPTCVASLTELSGNKVLIIRAEIEANDMNKGLVSWAIDANVHLENGDLFMEKYYKNNGVFPAKTMISQTWTIPLTNDEIEKSFGQDFICTAKALYVNLTNGEFYQITE